MTGSPASHDVVVCALGAPDRLRPPEDTTIADLRSKTPPEIRVVAIDRTDSAVREPSRERADEIERFGSVEDVALDAPRADIVLVADGVTVPPGWLQELRAAAYSDDLTATASAATPAGPLVDLGPLVAAPVQAAVLSDDGPSAVRIAAPCGACIYVRRTALDLVGTAELDLPAGELTRRATALGFHHVLAASLLVTNAPPEPDASEPAPSAAQSSAATRLRRAVAGLSVTIDARCLVRAVTGTQVHVLEVIHALQRHGGISLRVVTAPNIGPHFRESLEGLSGIELAGSDQLERLRGKVTPSLVVHRPYQLFDPTDLDLLLSLGQRLVITQQDLIAYANPAYARSIDEWRDLRRLTQLYLGLADRIVFFSEFALNDAEAEGLVDRSRGSVVPLGIDHHSLDETSQRRPEGLAAEDMRHPFVLCLGTDFLHKNRLFALRVFEKLRDETGWAGLLIFAGSHVTVGSSASEERAWLASHHGIASDVRDLGGVSDGEKQWLLAHAAAVLFPSVHEGFGLIPFEAAQQGTPVAYASTTALAEFLPDGVLFPWEASRSAAGLHRLLVDRVAAETNVAEIIAAGEHLRWAHTAKALAAIYERVVDAEPPPLRTSLGLSQRDLTEFTTDAARAETTVPIPVDVHRAYRAILARPQARRVVFRAVATAYRTARKLSRRDRAAWH